MSYTIRQRIIKKRQAEKRAKVVSVIILITLIVVLPSVIHRAMAEVGIGSPHLSTPALSSPYWSGDDKLITPLREYKVSWSWADPPQKPDLTLPNAPQAFSGAETSYAKVEAYIRQTAREYKIDENLFLKIATCENTNLVPHLKNPIEGCTATGIYQFVDSTWKSGIKRRGLDWNLADKKDYKKNIDMAAWFISVGEISHWNASKLCWS